MRARCNNVKHKNYNNYGGRNILVCSDWDDFNVFHTWAKENGYRGDLSIDRIDNDRWYSPSNCRWSDSQTQMDNRRNSRLITYKGEEKIIGIWARIVGKKRDTLYKRIFIYGWPINYSMTAPLYAPAPPNAKPKEKPEPVKPDKHGF